MLLADRLEAGGKDLWMFASGTGVSPFLAVLSDESITSRFERLILVHGVRTWNETGYVSRLVKRQTYRCCLRDARKRGGGKRTHSRRFG